MLKVYKELNFDASAGKRSVKFTAFITKNNRLWVNGATRSLKFK
jgi:hypothetical protein